MSLLELLFSLTLFFIILLMGLQFIMTSRRQFLKLKGSYESRAALESAAEKIRHDIQAAGQGLFLPASLEIIAPISSGESELIIRNMRDYLNPISPLESGQSFIPLESTSGLARNRSLCFCGPDYGETASIETVTSAGIVLSSPLAHAYDPAESMFLQLNEITFFLDEDARIVRRRVNSGSAQPLLEDVGSFSFAYAADRHLVQVRLGRSLYKEEEYEVWIFPRNVALAVPPDHE